MEMEDSLGNRGVKLSKELMKIAGGFTVKFFVGSGSVA
jgi:hypothetical protein